MKFQPKKTKYNKFFKGTNVGNAKRGENIVFGKFALKAIEHARLTSNQIESARKTIVKSIRKIGKLWIRIFPDIPVSKKPVDVRMGKGKGSVSHYICKIKPGRILFEIDFVLEKHAKEAFHKANSKLGVKTIFCKNYLV